MLIQRCELEGRLRDVRIEGACIAAIDAALRPAPGEETLDARGGALLPGLNDHHAHLLAAAAALRSLRCGPPHVRDAAQLERALSAAPGKGWLRGVGYHESVAGDLDRDALDRWVAQRPLRIQHRTGALWMLNGRAVDALGLDAGVDAPGVERDTRGRATGRLFRLDAWLGARVPREPAALGELSLALARCGVVGVTDTGADNDAERLAALVAAQRSGELRQRVLLLGTQELPDARGEGIARGALKLLLDERALPELGAFAARIGRAHAAGRGVAIHAVTRVELTFALAALAEAGARPGDRIEHASVAPPEALEALRRLGLVVVTQPSFVAERGDTYAREVEPADRPWLYRLRGFLAAGIRLAAGSDAPYGAPDPWRAMRAATERRSAGGRVLGSAEALTPEEALALFTSPLEAPGAPPPRLAVGARADLCLLRVPWVRARRELSAEHVAATCRAGEWIWREDRPA
jgi:predicted amidohydrolase YtcJ